LKRLPPLRHDIFSASDFHFRHYAGCRTPFTLFFAIVPPVDDTLPPCDAGFADSHYAAAFIFIDIAAIAADYSITPFHSYYAAIEPMPPFFFFFFAIFFAAITPF
jgi:hypothetical protein